MLSLMEVGRNYFECLLDIQVVDWVDTVLAVDKPHLEEDNYSDTALVDIPSVGTVVVQLQVSADQAVVYILVVADDCNCSYADP